MENKSGYAGKISQQGTQEVKAPAQNAGTQKGAKVHKGSDLRSGKK